MVEIDSGELAQRVAVLRRFRTLLLEQRERFRSYLDALDRQKDLIESGSPDDLLAHVELGEQIAADIFSIQKVIDPLEEMHRSLAAGLSARTGSPAGDAETADVSGLKAALEELKNDASARSARNRELLSRRMAEVRTEIGVLRNNPFAANARRSAFSGTGTASIIDIKG